MSRFSASTAHTKCVIVWVLLLQTINEHIIAMRLNVFSFFSFIFLSLWIDFAFYFRVFSFKFPIFFWAHNYLWSNFRSNQSLALCVLCARMYEIAINKTSRLLYFSYVISSKEMVFAFVITSSWWANDGLHGWICEKKKLN